MIFRGDEYLQAAIERIEQAHSIFRAGGSYALATYCAGVAVECILRAFRWKKDPSFDGRHDLLELTKSSGLLDRYEDYLIRRRVSTEEIHALTRALQKSLHEIALLWSNNLRYASEKSYRAYLNRIHRLKGTKGDPLKANAVVALNAARIVVERGRELWD